MFLKLGVARSIPLIMGMLVVTKVDVRIGQGIGSFVSGCMQDVKMSFLCWKSLNSS